jgi:FkbM family methyltransferase
MTQFPFDQVIRHRQHLIAFDRQICSGIHLEAIGKQAYERCELTAIHAALQPGDRVLELGSGIGVVSTAIAEIVGSHNLLCCEANPVAAAVLRRTLALNGCKSHVCEGAAVSNLRDDCDSTLPFNLASNFLASSIASGDSRGETIEVRALPLEPLIDEHRIDCLVIDIEGGECALLNQARLNSIRRIVVELHPGVVGADQTASLLDRLSAAGFFVRWDLVNEDVFVLEREGLAGNSAGLLKEGLDKFVELRLAASTADDDRRLHYLSELASRWPGNRNVLLEMAYLLLAKREWEAARNVLRRAEAFPLDAFQIHLTGLCLFQSGRLEDALACWRREIELGPDRSLAHAMTARCALRLGRNEDALAAIQAAVALCPYVASYWDLFGQVALSLGRPGLAEAAARASSDLI